MSRLHPDVDRRPGAPHALGALAFALFTSLSTLVIPAETSSGFNARECPVTTARGRICINGTNIEINSRDDSLTFDNVELRDFRGTRVVANHARAVIRNDDLKEINFTGKVHAEFRGALLDADTARMLLQEESLISLEVKGSQAKFSHQLDGAKRRIDGTADAISYVAATGDVTFSGNTSYTNGVSTLNTPRLEYNLNTQIARAPNSTGTFRIGEDRQRVPAPRTPDRSTAP